MSTGGCPSRVGPRVGRRVIVRLGGRGSSSFVNGVGRVVGHVHCLDLYRQTLWKLKPAVGYWKQDYKRKGIYRASFVTRTKVVQHLVYLAWRCRGIGGTLFPRQDLCWSILMPIHQLSKWAALFLAWRPLCASPCRACYRSQRLFGNI